jgi:hypothetical protein
MDENKKNRTYANIDQCIRSLYLAIRAFQKFLGDRTASDLTTFNQAVKYLEESKIFHQEATKEISELMGAMPSDVSPGFKKWKEGFLKESGILSEGKEYEELKSELQNDDFLLGFLTPEEIGAFFAQHYESQKTGQRKLENIKARIALDKISNLMNEAESLHIRSKEQLYQLK